MPPSAALRFFPGRAPRGENHKRGHSFGSEALLQEKDNDLALFKEMESREREDFLLQSFDDFEDTFSTKLKHFSESKIGISVPIRGETSELLNSDVDKNDYEWLLTPPDTPLFPSLDDEPPPVAAASRGRPRSQPIAISRSSTTEKRNQSSRGSASPNRLSPSPRSGNATFQSRARPSSASRSSPSPSLRPATPSRRPSPPLRKPSTSAPRSPTPTSGRTSGVSGSLGSSGVRGTSPVRMSRGNSPSPNMRAWQSNIPGFLMDSPPNLRTSLADRPASFVRGSSPASGNMRDSAGRYRRQSTSPTPSRSASSSYSHDRDQFSCQSKGSVASSMDDDSDSLQSGPLGGSESSFSKRVGSLPSNRGLAFSKKPSRIVPPGSAPKRSFDSAIRQMDHRKNSQNMFRPLMSSAPSSTFYIGKGSSHRPILSRNSLMTTTSGAGSDQRAGFAPDVKGHYHPGDLADSERKPCPDAQEHVFAHDHLLDNQHLGSKSTNECDPSLSEKAFRCLTGTEASKSSNASHTRGDAADCASNKNVEICPKCRSKYHSVDPVEVDIKLCPDCREQRNLGTVNFPDTRTPVASTPLKASPKLSEKHRPSDAMDILGPAAELPLRCSDECLLVVTQDEENLKHICASHDQESQSCVQEENSVVVSSAKGEERANQLEKMDECLDVHTDSSGGTGISVLLKRSGSSKGPVFQGRAFVASPKPFEALSYARDTTNSVRSSTGYGSSSASSSVDYGPIRQTETCVQRQFGGKKFDLDISRSDVASISSLSRVSNHDHLAASLAAVSPEEYSEAPASETISPKTEEKGLSCSKVSPSEDRKADLTNSFFTPLGDKEACPSLSESSGSTVSAQLEDDLASSVPNPVGSISHEAKDAQGTASSVATTSVTLDSPPEEHTTLDYDVDSVDMAEFPAHCSLSTISETEVENACQDAPDLQTHDQPPKSKSVGDGLQELQFTDSVDNDVAASVPEPNSSDHPHEILEESSALMDSHEGSKARSLTLEEATDAILFCSAIVHNLAYKAASLAIDGDDNEEPPLQDLRPTVTVLGKSNTERNDWRSRNSVHKRNSRATKSRQAQVEAEAKTPSKTENDKNAEEPIMRNVGVPDKVDGMKPPKLESKCNCKIM